MGRGRVGGGAQSWCRGGVGSGGPQASLGQKGVSTHPFDPAKSTGVNMTSIRREGWWGTVGGEHVKGNEEGHRGYSSDRSSNSSSTSSSTKSSKRLDGRWDATSSIPFDRGKTPRALPWHVMFECSIA